MSSHFLPVYRSNAEDDVGELRAALQNGGLDFRGLNELTKCCRIASIAALLMNADTQEFVHGLRVSASCTIQWLERHKESGLVVSRCSGIHDALAATDWAGAQRIAELLEDAQWSPDAEYEEDFLAMRLLIAWLRSGDKGRQDRVDVRERAAKLGGDESDVRFELWSSLDDGDSAAFDQALEGFVAKVGEDYDYFREKDALTPEELATLGWISIEGIAFWRLGRRAGLELQDSYLFMPGLVLSCSVI